jgi:hypothetical protein
MANVVLKKASADDFDLVYELLLDFKNHKLKRGGWQQLFKPHWDFDEGYYGYILMEDDQPIGFLSTIFSKRKINNREYRFCNLSSWVVKEGFRNRSFHLIKPLTQLKDYTITLFTPSKIAQNIFSKLGYQNLESNLRILLPFPESIVSFVNKNKITLDKNIIKRLLRGDDLKIFNDHAGFNCFHALIFSDAGTCYVIIRKVFKNNLPFAYIHYISNLGIFNRAVDKFKLRVMMELKVIGVIVEERFLENRNLKLTVKRPFVTMYKSPDLQPRDIDSLYSEFFLMNLQ